MTIYPVMDIQRFCVHDGPGIRTVVFFKGCPLHCPWCANPESQTRKRSLFYDGQSCMGCGVCQASCPNGAISIEWKDNRSVPVIDRGRCRVCGSCGSKCPAGAVTYSGTIMTAREILDEVRKDADYYEASGGGVTLSGGEVFAMGEDLSELLGMLRAESLSVAVETCGQFAYDAVENCLDDVDLFLYDVKHVDRKRLKAVTGGDSTVIMGNLSRLLYAGKQVVVRIPVIPGFNHTLEDMEQIMKAVKALGVERVELLPYHTFGKGKYEKLGRRYEMGDVSMLTESDLEMYDGLLPSVMKMLI